MGQMTPGGRSGPDVITPPAGVEVDESVQIANGSGLETLRNKSWDETLDGDILHVELTTLPSRQYEVAFWLLPRNRRGCKMFGRTMYNERGRALNSTFWRNAPSLKVAGGADFPRDLCPDSVPGVVFFRALEAPRDGAGGTLSQQITSYSFVKQDVRVAGTQRINVPAGAFSALKVTARAQVGSLLPTWPGFVVHMIGTFVPKSIYYFQAEPPYRLLKTEGTWFVGGPEVTTQLVGYHMTVEKSEKSTTSSPKVSSASNTSRDEQSS